MAKLKTGTTIDGNTAWHAGNLTPSDYAPLASPALTGTPTAPTAAANTNTTQISTTAYVQQEITDYASTVTTALAGKISTSEKGAASGVATLDSNGFIPADQLGKYIQGGLRLRGTLADSNNTNTIYNILYGFTQDAAYNTAAGASTSEYEEFVGNVYVAVENTTLQAGSTLTGHAYTIQAPGDEGDSTLPIDLEPGDMLVVVGYSYPSSVHTWQFAIINNNDPRFLLKSGDTMTGNLTMGTRNIYGDLTTTRLNLSGAPAELVTVRSMEVRADDDDSSNTEYLKLMAGQNTLQVTSTSGGGTDNQKLTYNGNKVFHDGYHPNADTLTTARTISLAGDVTGSASFNGSANISITATVADDSHNHTIANVDGLQTALDGKLGTSAKAADSNLLDGIDSGSFLRSDASDTYTGNLTLSQNPVGTTYGNGASATPTTMIAQTVGDNDGWRLYGEAPAANDVKMIFEVVDDNETGDTWVFRNKKTYSPYTATEDFKITGEGTIYARANGYVNGTQRIFADDYHPNADKLTTARNIALSGAVTGNANFDGSGNISIATTHTADPTITLTGAVTGSGTMTNLGNVSIATTATADPTLTINGDASGSATFTNLGNATLTLTVNDDSHNHTIANVDGLQTALDGKSSTGHNHSASEIVTGELNTARLGSGTATAGLVLKSDGDGTASWQADNNTTYTLGSFGITATAAELNKMDGVTATTTELNYVDGVTSNIQTQLNGKAASSHSHGADVIGVGGISFIGKSTSGGGTTSELSVATAQSMLGLGSAAYTASTAYAAASHNHSATQITSGTIATARLGSGTANSSTYLRGDNTWASIPGGGIGGDDVEWAYVGKSTDASTAATIVVDSTDLGSSFDWANYDYKFVYQGSTTAEDTSATTIYFDGVTSTTDKYSYQYQQVQQTAETTETESLIGDAKTTFGISTGVGISSSSSGGYATDIEIEFTVRRSGLSGSGLYAFIVKGTGNAHYWPSTQSLTSALDGMVQSRFVGTYRQDSAITSVTISHNFNAGTSDSNVVRVYRRRKT